MTLRNSVPYPLILEAAERLKSDQWALADALLKECGPPKDTDNDRTQLSAVAEMLEEHGHEELTLSTLSALWKLAYIFPANRRHKDIGWSIHAELKDADLMDCYMRAVNNGSFPLSRRAARQFVHRLTDQWNAKWDSENNIDTPKQNRAPSRSDLIAFIPKDAAGLSSMGVSSHIIAKIEKAKQLVEESLSMIQENPSAIDPAFVSVIALLSLEAHQKCLEVNRTVTKTQPNKRGHIMSVPRAVG